MGAAHSGAKYVELDDTYEFLIAVSSLVPCIIGIAMTIGHGMKMYSDFFTNERKALNHRVNKPVITPYYKKVAYLTYASVVTITIAVVCGAIQYNFSMGGCRAMFPLQVGDKFFYFSSKCLLYLVFIYRLYQVYGTSGYGYPKKTLHGIGVAVVVVNIVLFIVMQLFTKESTLYFDDTDNVYPWFCLTLFEKPWVAIMGALMMLVDVVACIAAMCFFIVPLNKVVKAFSENQAKLNDVSKTVQMQQMIYIGYKYKVLVWVAAISTLSWMILFMIGYVNAGIIVAQADFVINPICLLLMTEYYPSDKYYARLCFLCICCFDWKGNSYKSHASKRAHDESVDTDLVLLTRLLGLVGSNNAAVNLSDAMSRDKAEKEKDSNSPPPNEKKDVEMMPKEESEEFP